MLEDKVAQEIRKFHEAVTKLQEKEGSLLGSYFSSGYAPDRSAERSHQTPENPERHWKEQRSKNHNSSMGAGMALGSFKTVYIVAKTNGGGDEVCFNFVCMAL